MQFHSDEPRWFLISLTSGIDYLYAILITTWGQWQSFSGEGTPNVNRSCLLIMLHFLESRDVQRVKVSVLTLTC
jgi:hypothetical protein